MRGLEPAGVRRRRWGGYAALVLAGMLAGTFGLSFWQWIVLAALVLWGGVRAFKDETQ